MRAGHPEFGRQAGLARARAIVLRPVTGDPEAIFALPAGSPGAYDKQPLQRRLKEKAIEYLEYLERAETLYRQSVIKSPFRRAGAKIIRDAREKRR